MGLTALAAFAGATVVGVVVVTSVEVQYGGQQIRRLTATMDSMQQELAAKAPARQQGLLRANVATSFSSGGVGPSINPSSFVDPLSSVLGAVVIEADVYVAPYASVRGDEGQPIYIGSGSNIQDGVVIHALETMSQGASIPDRTYRVAGKDYAVYVGRAVSLAHQALVHGPARIDDNVFVGMQAMVFKASVGEGAVLEPGAKVIGVSIPAGRYVPAGTTVTSQAAADRLPVITESYAFRGLNEAVVHVNTSFARSYGAAARPAPDTAAAVHAADARPAAGKH